MQTLILKTDDNENMELLLQLAKKLHMNIEVLSDEALERKAIAKLAETSFAKDWNSKEDDHWDDFLKNAKDVSTR